MRSSALLFALATLPAPALAEPVDPQPLITQHLNAEESAAIDRAVTEVLARTGVPSAQIAVVRNGALVLNKAWGKASESIPQARPDLPYQIASNSKQFLAALLLILENDGKLSLNDTIDKWLPEVSGAKRITIRMLLSHTAGLQDYWPQDYSFAEMERPVSPQDIVHRWAMKPLDYEPGTRRQYSNTGYVVAGLIAEQAGGKPLMDQLRERIFVPLGIRPHAMDDTTGPAFPQGYHRNALGPVRAARPAARGWLWAAGELAMTAGELAKWNQARLTRSLLAREDWEEMERPVRLSDGTATGYGLGVTTHLVAGRRVVDHGGESVGFLSQNSVWIDDGVAVSVLTNADFADAQDELTQRIAEVVLPKAPGTDANESARLSDARSTLRTLIAGQFDPARFTANARYYFNAQTRTDYSRSLKALGPLTDIVATRPPRMRGGFVNRVFSLQFGSKKLLLSTYAEPGANGRWEQFIVIPD